MNSLFVKRACAALLAVMLAASFTACRSEEASGSGSGLLRRVGGLRDRRNRRSRQCGIGHVRGA